MALMRILDRTIDKRQRKSPNLPPDLESQKGKKVSSEFQQQPIHFQPKQHVGVTSLPALFVAGLLMARINMSPKLIVNAGCYYTLSSIWIPYRRAAPQNQTI